MLAVRNCWAQDGCGIGIGRLIHLDSTWLGGGPCSLSRHVSGVRASTGSRKHQFPIYLLHRKLIACASIPRICINYRCMCAHLYVHTRLWFVGTLGDRSSRIPDVRLWILCHDCPKYAVIGTQPSRNHKGELLNSPCSSSAHRGDAARGKRVEGLFKGWMPASADMPLPFW